MVNWNSLFLAWIKEWKDQADVKNAPVGKSYGKALQILEKCPKQFQHPQELKQLQSFGPKICLQLEKRFQQYCIAHAIDVPLDPTKKPQETEITSANKTQKARKRKQWVPQVGSGAYGIVLTLTENEQEYGNGHGMGKSDIIRFAKRWCDEPFEANPKSGQYHSAWNSIKTLINNDIVYASAARNAHYYLTDLGRQLGLSLLQASVELSQKEASHDTASKDLYGSTINSSSPLSALDAHPQLLSPIDSIVSIDENEHTTTEPPLFTAVKWRNGSYRIKLIVDNREVRTKGTNDDFFGSQLSGLGIDVDKKSLAVGDALWVAEHKHTGQYAVIDYILERKRVDDLLSSVFDGRFHEQKFRLSRSSILNIIYLVEGSISGVVNERERAARDGKKTNYKQIIQTAMAQTIALNHFALKRTVNPEHTVRYMTDLTRLIKEQYKRRDLIIAIPSAIKYKEAMEKFRNTYSRLGAKVAIAYDAFEAAMSKSGLTTIKDVYIRLLMSTKGVTLEKALAIQKVYTTPRALFDAYESLNNDMDKKNLIYDTLLKNISRKRVGKTVSERLYQYWGAKEQ